MRRLPIFFLLDVSESMVGQPLTSLEEGMQRIVTSLQRDPHALESVFISVIAFAGKAEVISPLTEVALFYTPRLPIGGGTELGAAMELLMYEIDTKVIPQTKTQKGDWKPIVFLITDGEPTSPMEATVKRWKERYATKANLVAITLGRSADYAILNQLTQNVIVYEGSSDEEFRKFVDWISASVKSESQKVEHHSVMELIELSKQPNLKKADTTQSGFDPNSVILTGRCQVTKRPYLIKYLRTVTVAMLQKYDKAEHYKLDGIFPISEDYFKWTKPDSFGEVRASALQGIPSCPHCGGITAVASCRCGRIMCINGEGEAKCPWCGTVNYFEYGEGDFNIQRGQG
ncbi:MAG: VWA domain-containing protein [Campylobacterales bacterium]|nr:VWA domain-containing protein [Campylobacterales bacterium]